MHPIAITNVALVTPLTEVGVSTWEALCAGRRVSGADGTTAVREEVMAALAGGLGSGVRELVGDGEVDKSIRLAGLAAGLALGERGRGGGEAGLFCGTSKGPVYTMMGALERMGRGAALTRRQAEQVALGVGAMGPMVAGALGLRGVMHTSVAACSSGMHALYRAARAIDSGECERAVVVAADASLHGLFEGSFARLGVLSPLEPDGSRRCEPFGAEGRGGGRGFFLTEAAAAVVLEREPRGKPLAWLEDVGVAGDGTDLIAIDKATAGLRRTLAAMGAPPLAFVHAHATGTGHDAQELAAIRAVLGEVPVFSHKARLGHTLGAAGLVSVVLSALSHAQGCTYEGHAVAAGARSLTIAQGFGGHIAVARLLL